MSDDQQKKRAMNDISHLFLSNVREAAGNGSPRPQRSPPGGFPPPPPPRPARADLTADEIDQVTAGPLDATDLLNDGSSWSAAAANDLRAVGYAETAPVTAVLASHLNGRQAERVRDYARHLAASGGRVGLIDLDVTDFRLTCFDPSAEPGAAGDARPTEISGAVDPRAVAAAIEELNVDVDRWVLLLPNLRTPEAAALVADAEHWALLCTPDHDGVVAAYRTLKGVAEARSAGGDGRPPTRLTVAVMDAAGDAEAARVQQKLAGVSRQFLGWDADAEPPVRYAAAVAEHPLMNCRVPTGRGQGVVGPHWAAVAELLARPRRGANAVAELPAARAMPAPPAETVASTLASVPAEATAAPLRIASPNLEPEPVYAAAGHAARAPENDAPPEPSRMRIEPMASPNGPFSPAAFSAAAHAPAPFAAPAYASNVAGPATAAADDEVLDLPGDAADARGILAAVLRRPDWGLAECPVTPPTCAAAARVAVTRDRGLALVAVAARGLTDLRAIGVAYRWMTENAGLIAMALPQFAIDAGRAPGLHLLVDQADISGESLRTLMGADHVRVRAYRTLRWAGRTGLLLDAA